MTTHRTYLEMRDEHRQERAADVLAKLLRTTPEPAATSKPVAPLGLNSAELLLKALGSITR